MHPVSFLLKLLVEIPLVVHFLRGFVEPSEFKIKVVAVLIQQKVHLDIFANNKEPRLCLCASYCRVIHYFWALKRFQLLNEFLRSRKQMSAAKARANNRVGFLREPKFFKLDYLDVFHLINLAKVDKLGDRGKLSFCEKCVIFRFALFFVNLGSEAPHKVFLWPFD